MHSSATTTPPQHASMYDKQRETGYTLAIQCVKQSCIDDVNAVTSYVTSINAIASAIVPSPLHVHLFSIAPVNSNVTAALALSEMSFPQNPGSSVTSHFNLRAFFSFHLMTTADMLIAAQGGQGLLMTVLQHGIVFRVGEQPCKSTKVRKDDGTIDVAGLKHKLDHNRRHTPNMKQLQECHAIRPT
jgi:hypothetical protein